MEPNQSKQLSDDASKLVSKRRKARIDFNPLKILKINPWLLLGGCWLCLIVIGATAIFSITNTGFENLEQIAAQKPENYSRYIVWLLSGSLFGIGSIVIAKQLNRLLQSYRLRQATQQLARQERRRRLQEKMKAPPTLIPPISETIEIISPPEHEPPQALESESLAEMMDVRKHRSLDSILRDL